MLGPIGSNLMAILKVLTPAEIDRYAEEVLNAEPIVTKIAAGGEDLPLSSNDEHYSSQQKSPLKEKESEEVEHEAEIIPIHDKIKIENLLPKEEELSPPKPNYEEIESNFVNEFEGKIKESNDLASVGIYSAKQIKAQKQQELDQINKNKESTTVFILNQREKLKRSKEKLAEQAAILLYRKNAAQEFVKIELSEQDIEDGVESKNSTACGVLIDKKHF